MEDGLKGTRFVKGGVSKMGCDLAYDILEVAGPFSQIIHCS